MFRLRLIRHLFQAAPQVTTTQECIKFTKCGHYQSCATKITSISENTVSLTSGGNVGAQSSISSAGLTEKEFLVKLKNDPDTFGDSNEKDVFDEGDLKEEKYFEDQPPPSQKLRTKQYADIIKAFIRKRQIKEAIDVLEVKMLKEDRVKPENYIYNLVLGACGRVGYTKKAFSLYNQMKKRGLKVHPGTYTALFNACANSPWPEDGLTRAKHLREIMIEKMYEPNDTNYNAMIKAFGRCGDLPTAFSLVDEMISKGFKIKDDTINFLLQAAIQDKDAGFRHALLIWRKMIDRKIAPSLYTFNLMLRCIRDCEMGNVDVMNELLDKILGRERLGLNADNKLLLECTDNKLLIEGPNGKGDKLNSEVDLVISDNIRPNLLARTPHLGNIISLSEVKKPEDRLLLVGGMNGFLDNMMKNKCTPDIKTFTQLLDCLPGSLAAEHELFKALKKFDVKPDLDFFNMLIKKRSMRFDYENAKLVLLEMKKYNYKPNLITYGVLSLGCKTKEEALELLEEMKEHSFRLNTEILGAMLHQACYHMKFSYVLEIMEILLREGVKPSKIFIKHLEDFKKKCKAISNDKNHKLFHSASFQKGYKIFKMRYKTWLEEVEVDDTEDTHPWTQFREPTDPNAAKQYKDKSIRFKARHLSKFKVKTSTKIKKNK